MSSSMPNGASSDLSRRLLPALLVSAAAISGCAHIYVDEQGRTHAFGLIRLTLPKANDAGAQSLRVRSVGLAITRAEVASSLVFGYQDTTLAFLRNHVLVNANELRLPGADDTGEDHVSSPR